MVIHKKSYSKPYLFEAIAFFWVTSGTIFSLVADQQNLKFISYQIMLKRVMGLWGPSPRRCASGYSASFEEMSQRR